MDENNKTDDTEQLLQLNELLTSGIITQEDFDEKKKQLLNASSQDMPSALPTGENSVAPKASGNKKPNKTLIFGIAAAAVVVIIIIALIAGGGKNFNKKFGDIADESWCYISEDGSYMKIDTNPYDIDDYFDTDAYYKIKDINEELGFSETLYDDMGHTSALDGKQTETNGKVKASWRYHPDNGLEVTYEWVD